jgi:hypothetical protein
MLARLDKKTGQQISTLASARILVVASTILSVALAESLLRFNPLLRPLPHTYIGEYANRPSRTFDVDPVTGWRMRPHLNRGLYQSNAQGFRGNSDFDALETKKKIVLAGDSFTFGYGVELRQTFGAIVESRIRDDVVYNLAMPGFGLDQIWLSVQSQALPLKPNLVIVAFISADFTRSQEAYRITEGFNKPVFKLVDGSLVPKTSQDRPNFLVRLVQDHSSLWRAGDLAARSVAHRIAFGEWWSLNAAILDAIRNDCRKSGVPVLFVCLPTKQWLHFPALRSYMERAGANYVDVTQTNPFRADAFIPGDDHLNAKGHQYVAEAVLTWIHQNMPEL